MPHTLEQTEKRPTSFDAHNPPENEYIDDCVHCGFCLPACPTYVLWGEEMDSPRGRIYMIKKASDGEAPLDGRTELDDRPSIEVGGRAGGDHGEEVGDAAVPGLPISGQDCQPPLDSASTPTPEGLSGLTMSKVRAMPNLRP